MRRQAIVHAPLVNAANHIRFSGNKFSHESVLWYCYSSYYCVWQQARKYKASTSFNALALSFPFSTSIYLRIAFSDGVIASAYSGRENKRSAYFNNGAA